MTREPIHYVPGIEVVELTRDRPLVPALEPDELLLAPEARKTFYADEVKRYKSEKAEIMQKAEAFEKESKDFDDRSAEQMHQHHRWAQATTALQIAIALAAIALLTKKRWMEKLVFGVSALGLVIGIAAWLHV